ncbi:MAG: DUF4864 domain-containing protein [Marinobacter sp.]|nr:DUF4864 domain-containing protein [Marinobacter sp.]
MKPSLNFLFALSLCLLAAGVSRQALADEPADGIRDAILSQIEAFATDDAESAWHYASTSVKQRLQTPRAFLRMVRSQYPAIYQASAIHFGRLIPHDGFQIQQVQFQGPSGLLWDSFYTMVNENDHWAIGGVDIWQAETGI